MYVRRVKYKYNAAHALCGIAVLSWMENKGKNNKKRVNVNLQCPYGVKIGTIKSRLGYIVTIIIIKKKKTSYSTLYSTTTTTTTNWSLL